MDGWYADDYGWHCPVCHKPFQYPGYPHTDSELYFDRGQSG